MTIITRDTPIPFGKPDGPLKGKTLAQLEDKSVQYLVENAQETDWMRAAQQEASDRLAGLRSQGQPTNGAPAPAPVQGQGPGYPAPAPAPAPAGPTPYNAPKASKWETLPLPVGPAGMAGKHMLDSLVLATHYAFSKLLMMGWSRHPATAEAAEKLAVSAIIACTDRGIDLLQELTVSGQVPPPLPSREEEEADALPF